MIASVHSNKVQKPECPSAISVQSTAVSKSKLNAAEQSTQSSFDMAESTWSVRIRHISPREGHEPGVTGGAAAGDPGSAGDRVVPAQAGGPKKGRAKQVYQLSCNRIVLDCCASISNRSGLSNTLMLKGSEGCGGKGD